MTLSSQAMRIAYAGNGSSVAFTVPFFFLANADLRVFLRAADGTETLKAETTHYNTVGAGNPAGGTITFLAPPASGETVVILREPAIVQETDYIEAEKFPAETHERALDKLTMIAQRTDDRLDRSLALNETDSDGTGAFRSRGNRITDIAAPLLGSDAVRKSDLDAAITATGITPNPYLELAEIPSPANPAANDLRLFAKDISGATHLVARDGAGVETDLHSPPPADNAVTNAKLADMASKRFKARTSALAGDPEDLTVEQAFSMADQLSVKTAPVIADQFVIRDSAAGVAKTMDFDEYLKVIGGLAEITVVDENNDFIVGLDASDGEPRKIKPINFPGGIVTLATFTHSVNVAEVVFNTIPSGYAALLVIFTGVSGTAATPSFAMRVSENNGSSFLATGYGGVMSDTADGILATATSQFDLARTIAAAGSFSGGAILIGPTGPNTRRLLFSATSDLHTGQSVASNPVNALRFFWDSGNIDGGSIVLCGVR